MMAIAEGSTKLRRIARGRRHVRVRKRLSGTSDRPRLCVFRSLRNIYAQIIDDTTGRTIVSASSLEKAVRETIAQSKGKISMSKAVGLVVAGRGKEKGIEKVSFDRGGYRFHGRVKALADAAREGGLVF
jgi:large subunit ribosomal protein L18